MVDDCDDRDESSLDRETSDMSLPIKLTHLGFHTHPTITPIMTAIQSGVMKFKSSPNTSTIEGPCRISNKAESKTISGKGEKENRKKERYRRTN